MYTRNYYSDQQDRLNLPDNYDGTAFMERQQVDNLILPDEKFESGADENIASHKDMGDCGNHSSSTRPSILSSLFQGNNLFSSIGLSMPNLGAEEILIIATAAFLFFSKSGDRECALILLLLLFIN